MVIENCSAATSKSFGTFFPFQIILRFGKRKQCKISWMRWTVYALKHQILQTIYQLASPVKRCIVLQKENIFPELPCCFSFDASFDQWNNLAYYSALIVWPFKSHQNNFYHKAKKYDHDLSYWFWSLQFIWP